MIFTLFIGFCALLAYENITNKPVKWVSVGLLRAVSFFRDRRLIAPVWIVCFYIFRNNRKKRFVAFGVLAAVEIISCYSVIIAVQREKGSAGAFHKWIFLLVLPLAFFDIAVCQNSVA
jgi:hypothetical protein